MQVFQCLPICIIHSNLSIFQSLQLWLIASLLMLSTLVECQFFSTILVKPFIFKCMAPDFTNNVQYIMRIKNWPRHRKFTLGLSLASAKNWVNLDLQNSQHILIQWPHSLTNEVFLSIALFPCEPSVLVSLYCLKELLCVLVIDWLLAIGKLNRPMLNQLFTAMDFP